MNFDPATAVQDFLAFGEFGGVNPSITDSSTFTFMSQKKMEELFDHPIEGCFLYSRHWNPSAKYLSDALARMEAGQAAQVMGSGMAAISCALLQLCDAGGEIVSGRTIYGGTYALMKNLLPRWDIRTRFVDITNLDARDLLRGGQQPAPGSQRHPGVEHDRPGGRRHPGRGQHLQPDDRLAPAPGGRPRHSQPYQVHQRLQ